LRLILDALPASPPKRFEVIIDYKGMRRPPIHAPTEDGPSYWDIYEWQVQTYAHLRSTHEDSLPVVAGAIVYINELLPTRDDIESLRKEMRAGTTDIMPESRSEIRRVLSRWRKGDELPTLPLDFRLRRAMRVVQISPDTIERSLGAFDNVVARIEICRGRELAEGRVLSTWEKNAADEDTCVRCDSRTYCPSYKKETAPRLPAVRRRR
jgi:hypothetical protein